jgi:hypothetical protein
MLEEVGAIDLNRLGGSVNRPYQHLPLPYIVRLLLSLAAVEHEHATEPIICGGADTALQPFVMSSETVYPPRRETSHFIFGSRNS